MRGLLYHGEVHDGGSPADQDGHESRNAAAATISVHEDDDTEEPGQAEVGYRPILAGSFHDADVHAVHGSGV